MKRVAGTLLSGVVVVSLLGVPAQARTKTTTRGNVSDKTMEGFAGYTFIGKTRPSNRNDTIVFQFKRVGADKWRKFKPGSYEGWNAFQAFDKPRDRINRNHGWKIWFISSVPPGRWILRAKFLQQDDLVSSAVKRWVRVGPGD